MLTVTKGHGVDYLLGQVGAGGERYYLDATAKGEPPGRWGGRAAEEFGLDGDVRARDMSLVYADLADPRDAHFYESDAAERCARLGSAPRRYRDPQVVLREKLDAHPDALPEEIERWQRIAERPVRAAVYFEDLTFGVQKSVTVLHAAFESMELRAQECGDASAASEWSARRRAVEDAIHQANASVLEWMQDHAGFVRAGGSRSGRATHYLDAHEWLVASFFQHDNRDHEPHLHTHNAVLHRAVAADGEVYALDERALKAWAVAGRSVAERTLQELLTQSLGLSWDLNEAGHTRDVVGIGQEILEHFSGRTAKVTAKAQELAEVMEQQYGRELVPAEWNLLRQRATLLTRTAKGEPTETTEEMITRWDQELRVKIAGGLGRVANRFADAAPREQEPVALIPSQVIARALDTVQKDHSVWTRSKLIRALDLSLPDNLGGLRPGQVRALLEQLADEAVASAEVVQVTGLQPAAEVPAQLQRGDGTSVYEVEHARRYVTRSHLAMEERLRQAAIVRDRHAVDDAAVIGWLRPRAGMLGADQVAAVRGLATSGAGLAVLVGPAGAGKSHTAGALTAVWEELAGGRVVGLAVTQVATEVLAEDGVTAAANTRAWLNAQARLAEGGGGRDDEQWRLARRDIVLVDEASMLSTQVLGEIRQRVDAAGARMVLAGDPAQLGAVGAGGMMAVLAGGEAETYTLSDVRRFRDGWERAASLRLREGDADVVREYDRHGRILDGGSAQDARTVAARGFVADRLAGRSSVVVTDTVAGASELAGLVRAEMVRLGRVAEDGVALGLDGNVAGVGDIIQVRKIDWPLSVLNRRQYEVTAVREDGGLEVVDTVKGTLHQLPARFVEGHVQLGYASTVHGVQGMTVDTSWAVITDKSAGSAAYVALTRGRDRNTAVVVTQGTGEHVKISRQDADVVEEGDVRPARAILADVIEREKTELAAVAESAEAKDWARSMATLDARIEDAAGVAVRARTDYQFDRLAEAGVLTEAERARLGADQGVTYLSRVLRAAEQAGHKPADVLQAAIEERPLRGAQSIAQVLSARITRSHDLSETGHAPVPAGIVPEMSRYLTELHELAAQRRSELGEQAAAGASEWATSAFGSVPADDADRAAWQARVGVVAAAREASGWDRDDAALGPAPGLTSPERRAMWTAAWDELGRPAAQADEGSLSDGALLNRVWAWRRELEHAPAFVDEPLRVASLHQMEAGQEAVMADAEGRRADATSAGEEEAEAQAVVGELDDAARVRGMWWVSTAAHREAAVRASAELETRGIEVDGGPDRISVEDYLLVTEETDQGPELVQRKVQRPPAAPEPAADMPTHAEATAIAVHAAWVEEVLADRESQDSAYMRSDEWEAVEHESQAWEDTDGSEVTEAWTHQA